MAKKENIIIQPEIENIPFTDNIEEDIILFSPKTPTLIEQILESELPFNVTENTSYIIERKTDNIL